MLNVRTVILTDNLTFLMKGLQRLLHLATKDEHLILGLMSGTSLDGLDIALCRIKGKGQDTQVEVLHSTTYPYSESLQRKIRDRKSVV